MACLGERSAVKLIKYLNIYRWITADLKGVSSSDSSIQNFPHIVKTVNCSTFGEDDGDDSCFLVFTSKCDPVKSHVNRSGPF